MSDKPETTDGQAELYIILPPKKATFTYTNWKGETATRTAVLRGMRWGSTEWHSEPQWLLNAFDADNQDFREFAMRDMKDVVYV